ncbi:MAG: DUF4386 domain-containing protein [Thermoleophilia bacterium]
MDASRDATEERDTAGTGRGRRDQGSEGGATPEMPDRGLGSSPQVYARAAGLIYLAIAIIAPFAEFFVRQGLIVLGDVSATAQNIVASESLFRAGFAADLVVFVIEVALAAVLYVLLRPVSRTLALVTSFARLAMATILGFNLLNMFTGLQLLTAPEYATAFDEGQRQALAYVFLSAQSYGYDLGMVFFGLHLVVLGYLVYRSSFLPRILGILLVVSALGYLANSFTAFLAPEYTETLAVVVVVAAVIGELPLTLWLLIKGVNVERWQQRALEARNW